MSKVLLKEQITAFYERAKENYNLWNIENDKKAVDLHSADIQDILPKYKDYTIKVRVAGQGNVAKHPMISFLKYGQKNNEGFYPVLHYFGDSNTLVAFIGLSKSNEPTQNRKLYEEMIKFHRDPMQICNMDKDLDENLEKLVKMIDELITMFDEIYTKHG
jgi:hypothetical protein